MSLRSAAVNEEDLHAFVDGELEPYRQETVAAFLAASPSDRVRIENWRQQNMLVRATFAAVMHEALPPGLAGVSGAQAALERPSRPVEPHGSGSSRFRRITAAVAIFGLGLASGAAIRTAVAPHIWRLSGGPGIAGAGKPDLNAAARSMLDAVDRYLPGQKAAKLGQEAAPHAVAAVPAPDLTAIGLNLTAATAMTWERGPAGCFAFSGESSGFVVLCRARLQQSPDFDIRNIGSPRAPTIAWQTNASFYAVSGPAPASGLAAVARRIQAALAVAPSR